MPELLLDGDLVVFEPTLEDAVALGTLAVEVRGSAFATFEGRALCIERDVADVIASIPYSTASCPVPGTGRLGVKALDSEQLSSIATCSGDPVVLATGKLRAELTVLTPALGPPPASAPDANASYDGHARFQTVGFTPTAD